MSIGKANKPTPPKITTKIQPKNDIIAIIYTAREIYNVIDVLVTVGAVILAIPTFKTSNATSVYGKSTNLKNAQLMNNTMTDIMIAPNK
jgi:hypothetical protein